MDQILITAVEIYKIFIPLKEPFIISLGPVNDVQNIIIQIRTDKGITGVGECSPYMTINGESVDTCFIVAQYFATALKKHNALDIEGAVNKMDSIIYGNSSIKSAFDMALYDIASQYEGVPLYKFIGGENTKTLYTDMTVSIGAPEKMAADALRFKEEGFPSIKVKLGTAKDIDVKRIEQIRKSIGNQIPLRIDANQGWQTADHAIDILKALSIYNIEHCEEPIERWRFMELARVSNESPIPIMADESCGDDHDAERLIKLQACKMFNIKLGKSSGIFKALKIIKLASEANMHLQIGGFMESRIGMTAAAHLALSNDHIIHCDFDTPLMFTEDPVLGGITYKNNGVVEVFDVIGLGATVDKKYLDNAVSIIV